MKAPKHRSIPFALFALVLALSAAGLSAGQKLIFSGRHASATKAGDAFQSGPLIEPAAVQERRKENPMSVLYIPPADSSQNEKISAKDRNWLLQDPSEMRKELTGNETAEEKRDRLLETDKQEKNPTLEYLRRRRGEDDKTLDKDDKKEGLDRDPLEDRSLDIGGTNSLDRVNDLDRRDLAGRSAFGIGQPQALGGASAPQNLFNRLDSGNPASQAIDINSVMADQNASLDRFKEILSPAASSAPAPLLGTGPAGAPPVPGLGAGPSPAFGGADLGGVTLPGGPVGGPSAPADLSQPAAQPREEFKPRFKPAVLEIPRLKNF